MSTTAQKQVQYSYKEQVEQTITHIDKLILTKYAQKNAFDMRFQSIFCCITNFDIAYLGSGKTLTTLCLFYSRMKKFKNAVGITNIHLKNFKPEIQNRIIYCSSFTEIEAVMKLLPVDIRKIVLLDEAQNEFDKRMFGNKAQVHKTYFLNFFRKFNTEMYFNVVNLNRLEFRLDDMCKFIYISVLNKSKRLCKVYDMRKGKDFKFRTKFFFNKYNTLEYIEPTFEQTNNYMIQELTQDKTFKLLILEGTRLSILHEYISQRFHISNPKASLVYALYVVKGVNNE